MRLRALAVTTALALAVTGLSACTSKVGQAAVVGNDRISTKEVADYLNGKGPTAAALAQGPVSPDTFVLETMIDRSLYLGALKKTKGGIPSASELTAEHDAVASQISQGQASGAAFDKAITGQLTALGVRQSFYSVFIQTQELQVILVARQNVTTNPEYYAALALAKLPVSVSSRYGSWDAKTFTLNATGNAGRPPFVTIGADTAASPTASAGQ